MTVKKPEREKTISAMTDIKVLIIVGLGAGSVNRELADGRSRGSSAADIALKIFDNLTDLPRYSESFERRGTPSPVEALRTVAAEADVGADRDDLTRARPLLWSITPSIG